MSKKKGFVVGALIGSAIGATAALLFAPKSGKEMRKDIADKSSDLYEKGVLIAGEVKDKGGDVIQEVKEKGGVILSDVKEVSVGVKDSVVEKTQKIKKSVVAPKEIAVESKEIVEEIVEEISEESSEE